MARYKSLRNRATKNLIEDLRDRVVESYSHAHISRRRMNLLLTILDTFEREAFLPQAYTVTERNKEREFDKGVDNDK